MSGWRAYVGCRTTAERQARGQGVVVYDIDAAGRWTEKQVVLAGDNPSFLCLHPSRPLLLAVHGDRAQVSTFAVSPTDGTLRRLGTSDSGGRNPVHLAIDGSGQWLLVANYAEGNVASLPIGADGLLGPVAHTLGFEGAPGPVADQQRGSHPHQIAFHPRRPWIFVPDKGLDRVHTIALDAASGTLSPMAVTDFGAGAGPRHMVFGASGDAFVVGELDSTVHRCRVEPETGRLALVAWASTVPEDSREGNAAAGIVMSSDDRFIHVSNRGHDSIASFDVGSDVSSFGQPSWASSGGRTPRFIALAPDSQQVIAANERSDSICRIDPPFVLAQTGSPVCIVFQPSQEQP